MKSSIWRATVFGALCMCAGAGLGQGAANAGQPDTWIPGPNHPPLHLIPPMPMPRVSGDAEDADALRTVLLHNAETGETIELPLGEGDPLRVVQDDSRRGFDGGMPDDGGFTARGWGSMTIAGSQTSFPARTTCKLVMRYVDSGGVDRFFVCTGSMGDAGVVVTAGHCLYAHEPDGLDINDFAQEIWVYPAWDGGAPTADPAVGAEGMVVQRYGWAVGTQYLVGQAWVENESSTRDAACIRLNNRHPGMLTGWLGATSSACAHFRTYRNFSYPAASCDAGAGLHNGRDMYYWDGDADLCSASYIQVYIGSGCFNSFWGGMSGSACYWVDDGVERTNAVLTHHTTSGIEVGRCTRLWNQFVEDMQSFESSTRGNTFDLQALRYRTGGSTSVMAGMNLAGGTVQIGNISNANPSAGNYTLRLYLSTNNNISPTDVLLNTFNANGDFEAVENIQFNVPAAQIPPGTAPGEYWVGIIIDDSEDDSPGNNDTDTWDAQRITVTLCPTTPAPTNVQATDGVSCDEIEITWNGSAAATGYRIYRNTVNDYEGAAQIGFSSGTSFTDDNQVYSGLYYWYWVRAEGSCGLSPPSTSNRGHIVGTPNDLCVRALPMLGYSGSTTGDLTCAANDGAASCAGTTVTRDAWHLFFALSPGTLRVSTCGTHDDPGQDLGMDTILSLHEDCPGTAANELACNEDWVGIPPCFGDTGVRRDSLIVAHIEPLRSYRVRIAYSRGAVRDGRYNLNWLFTPDCAADINEDGFVTGEDFDAFVQMFEAGAPGADYDGDGFVTGADFDQFVQDFENGC